MSSSWTVEIESPVAAARLFKAGALDWHNLGPKLVPEMFSSASLVQGDGSVGTVRQFNFPPEAPFSYMKERMDVVDHEKFECKATLIEGGDLGTKVEYGSTHFKFEPTASGGCVFKIVATYKPMPGVSVGDEPTKAKEGVTKAMKAAEAYLLANPTAYA